MPPSLRRVEVWVADDSPTDLQRASSILAPSYAVRKFADGSALLEALTSARQLPDVVVTDWMMEGLSGLEVCAFLRTQPPPLRDVPVLLVTARTETARLVEGLEAGASDFLSKPYVDAELRARVASLARSSDLLRRAEAAEADVRRVLATAPDALLAVDANGVITFANEELGRILERSPDELVGVRLNELVPDFPIRNLSAGYGESLLPMPDVPVRGRIYSPSVRLLSTDTAESTTISLRDVTERRAAESRRLDFYSIIAHDLRTPLTAMMLRTDLILRGKHGVLRPELSNDLRKLSGNMRALVGMINDFLDLARLEGVGVKLQREPVAMEALVAQICEEFRPVFDNNEQKWIDETPGGTSAEVLGDRQRLMQVLTNLVGNALKFTPPGGRITTRVISTPSSVEVQIDDTGPGIPKEILPHVFERYSRAVESQQVVGSGLGLMIVREIVGAHGGMVGAESEEGHGSRFWFRLPKPPPRTLDADAEGASPQP